ncbi:hypothetical protein HYH03_016571 [Edaphochlamys debaryana]|uniref:Uncharacterized protein n=1 Tax=Edaphochlamys debaryana TaxID=47281 RepID=A0A836BQ42_9CHLO|nr:hypothetical protein HYH03_016571 [Edaphochlamys debaryana]|eukprot:KAG2484617.1 hypothetical protein HYH03_016571 [Edaphochlamys debaryana]
MARTSAPPTSRPFAPALLIAWLWTVDLRHVAAALAVPVATASSTATSSSAAATEQLTGPLSDDFPLPAGVAVCPSFARYTRLHRAALGQHDHLPGHLGRGIRHGGRHAHAARAGGRKLAAGSLDPTEGPRRSRRRSLHASTISTTNPTAASAVRSGVSGPAVGAGGPRARAKWLLTADPDGIADRLVNAVSAFYLALLTDRVLCIQPSHPAQPGLQVAYSAPFIDWTCGGLGPAQNSSRGLFINQDGGVDLEAMEGDDGQVEGADGEGGAAEGEEQAGSADATQAQAEEQQASAEEAPAPPARYDGPLPPQAAADVAAAEAAAAAAASQQTNGAAAAATQPGPAGVGVEVWNPTADDTWMDPDMPVYTIFGRSDLTRAGPYNATVLVLRMHRGISVAIFNNPHHRRQLEAMGLRPDTAFGCAAAYLFGVGAATRALAGRDPAMHAAMVDESVIKIGIQIRLGDDSILQQLEGGEPVGLSPEQQKVVSGYFDCAAALAASVKLHSGPDPPEGGPAVGPPLRIMYYIMTDTLAVRAAARKRFGDQVLDLPQAAVQFYKHVTPEGLQATVLEHWYFSRCHHHIITGHSGMGRTAAFAGLRSGPSLFSMEVSDGTRIEKRGCGVGNADRPLDVYNTWSGV